MSDNVSPILHFAAGGFGGFVGAITTAPLEMIKTRLQGSARKAKLADSTHSPGTRLFNGLKHVYNVSGVKGLWRGIGPQLTGTIPARAVYFGVYNFSKTTMTQQNGGVETPLIHWLSAVSAGASAVTITSPIWVIKTRMQLQTPEYAPYKNSFHCFGSIWRKEGVRGLFRGLSASLIGISEGSLQFVLYEQFKPLYGGENPNALQIYLASATAKFFACVVTYPHEVVRTRMREHVEEGATRKYRSFFPSLMSIAREEGRVGLYGGMGAHLMRVVPNAAIMFMCYEMFVKHAGGLSIFKADMDTEDH